MLILLAASAVPGEIIQVTNLPTGRSVDSPSISADGRFVAFASNGNLGGLNPTPIHNVFVYDIALGTFLRATAEDGYNPAISADGKWVAFSSDADYARRNADGSDEIFRFYRPTRRIYQQTRDDLGDGNSEMPTISGNGLRVAFETTSNIARRNPDFNNWVYLRTTLLSNDPAEDGESHNPVISADGKFVVFETTSNLDGGNADLSDEVVVYDATRRRLTYVTRDPNAGGDSSIPAISGDNRFITFLSSSNLRNLNPDQANAVFLASRRGLAYTVITATPTDTYDGDTPAINGDGRYVVFVTSFDATGTNADHNQEIMLYDRVRKTLTQVTDSTGCSNSYPKISGDGTQIAFLSRCDYTGGNADLSTELFVADNPLLNLVIHSEGALSTTVVDPDDRVCTLGANTIPRATYVHGDFDGNGIPEDRVTVPQALEGTYQIALTADSQADPAATVSLDATLDGEHVELVRDTVASITGRRWTLNNQRFRPSGSLTPVDGFGSRIRLTARLPHAPATFGPLLIRLTDYVSEATFDFGPIENLSGSATRRSTVGYLNGFAVRLQVTKIQSGATVVFSARDGNLGAFGGSNDATMLMIVQIGDDTDIHHGRYVRLSNGNLLLR